jgi:hypothetical protein
LQLAHICVQIAQSHRGVGIAGIEGGEQDGHKNKGLGARNPRGWASRKASLYAGKWLLAYCLTISCNLIRTKYFRRHISFLYPRVFAFRRNTVAAENQDRYSSTIDTGRGDLKPKQTILKEK